LWLVKREHSFGLIKKNNSEVLPPIYSNLSTPFDKPLIKIVFQQKIGLADLNGRILLAPRFDELKYLDEKECKCIIVREGKKLGLADSSGLLTIEPRYESIEKFSKDRRYAWTKVRKKRGFVSRSCVEIVPPKYKNIREMDNGLVRVRTKSRFILLAYGGRESTLSFSTAENYNARLVKVSNGKKTGLVDSICMLRAPLIYDDLIPFGGLIKSKAGQSYGLLSQNGEIILPAEHQYIAYYKNKDGEEDKELIILRLDNKYGLLNNHGKRLILTEFDEVKDFDYQLFSVEKNNLWGLYNRNGQEILPPEYSMIEKFEHGGIRVVKKTNGGISVMGLFDKTGRNILPVQYSSINTIRAGGGTFLYAGKDNKYFGLFNFDGSIVLPIEYEQISSLGYADSMVVVKQNTLNGVISLKKQSPGTVLPIEFDSISIYDYGPAIVFLVEKNEKWGLLEKKRTIVPIAYDFIGKKLNSNIRVVKDGYWGLLNASGAEITPFKYDSISYFDDTRLRTYLNQKTGILSETGKELLTPEFDTIRTFTRDFFLVNQFGKFGLYSQSGEQITPVQYDKIFYYSGNFAKFSRGGKFNYLDKSGQEISPLLYDEVLPFSDGMSAVRIGELWGFINTKGEEEVPVQYYKVQNFVSGYAWVKTTKDAEWKSIKRKSKK
jgi:hypothetical protein